MALFYIDRYSEDMLGKILGIIAVISSALLIGLLMNTTPATAGAFGVLGVFVLAYLAIMSIMTFFMYGLSRVIIFFLRMMAIRPLSPMSLRTAYYYATIIALAPVMLVSMASVGSVGPYELGLVGLLEVLGCTYVTKRRAR